MELKIARIVSYLIRNHQHYFKGFMQNAFICPFTKQPLELLSDGELALLNKKITANQLYFQPGVPLNFEISKAFVSANRVYVYPVMDHILMLQKQTAIVERNRTVHSRKRITESDVVVFHKALGFGLDGVFVDRPAIGTKEPSIGTDVIQNLRNLLSTNGNLLLTMRTSKVDLLLELTNGLNYELHIHMDDNPDRLRRVVGKLQAETLYVLCDASCLPLKTKSVDTFIAFNLEDQEPPKEVYESLKEILKPDRNHVCLVDATEKSRLQSDYNKDVRASKLKLWKKTSLPRIHFQEVPFV